MDGTLATEKSDPLIALRRIRVKDFRRIEQLDVEFPANVRVICFVGPNGSGKSSLISKLANALCQYTHETAPGMLPVVDGEAGAGSRLRYSSTGEIRSGQQTFLIRTDWVFNGVTAAHSDFAQKRTDVPLAPDFFPDGAGIQPFGPYPRFMSHWHPPLAVDDPISRSIVLIRPADRWERASYEETDEVVVTPPFSSLWTGKRAFPFSVRKWAFELEQFLYAMFIEQTLKRPLPSRAADLFAHVYTALIGEKMEFTVRQWPFVRVGPQVNSQLSVLSAGELDILVTAGLIIGQALVIAIKTNQTDLNPQGFVFIDEIDSHLHPQWQQKVIPILTKAFPNVTFVITTHSPFVLRSLSKGNSRVVRLPDGEVFNTEFNAWQIDDILGAVFEVPTPWSPGISKQLETLTALLKDPMREEEAIRLYRELTSHQSTGLKAECRRLAGLFGTAGFIEKLIHNANGSAVDGEGSLASTAELPT